MANVALSVVCVLGLCLFTVSSAPPRQETQDPTYPILLVPGLGGSQLYATISEQSEAAWPCYNYDTTPDFNIWVSVHKMFFAIDCVVDALTLQYNTSTRTTHNGLGTNIDIDRFGSTISLEYLDPYYIVGWLAYYADIVGGLLQNGYERNVNLFGAPYDFRRAPNEMGELFDNLTSLIENASSMNGGSPVVVVAHSMGNPVMLYFYNHKSQEWKDQFIRAHISLAGVWGGAVRALQLVTSGYNMGAGDYVNPITVRPVERSMVSTSWMLPSKSFWAPSEVLVSTYDRDYTVDDYEALYNDIGFIDGFNMWEDTKDLIYDLEPPRVAFHCLHGYGVDTPGSLFFSPDGFPDQQPTIQPDDGDGTVNLRSLKGCLRWKGKQKQGFNHTALAKVSHTDIIHDQSVFNYILKVAIPDN